LDFLAFFPLFAVHGFLGDFFFGREQEGGNKSIGAFYGYSETGKSGSRCDFFLHFAILPHSTFLIAFLFSFVAFFSLSMWLMRLCIAGRAGRRNSRGNFLGCLVVFGVTRFIFFGFLWDLGGVEWDGMGCGFW
jgi:hypothetical protein